MFPASNFAKWETVMIAEELEGEGVAKSDAALNNEARVEPLEKKGKFEVRPAVVPLLLILRCSPCFLYTCSTRPLHYLSLSVGSLCLTAVVSFCCMRSAHFALHCSNMQSENIFYWREMK